MINCVPELVTERDRANMLIEAMTHVIGQDIERKQREAQAKCWDESPIFMETLEDVYPQRVVVADPRKLT